MKKFIIIETIILIIVLIFSIHTIINNKNIDVNHLNIAIDQSKKLFQELQNLKADSKDYNIVYTDAISSYKLVYSEHRNFLEKYNKDKIHITNIMNETYGYLIKKPELNNKVFNLINQSLDFIKNNPEFSDSDYLYQLRNELMENNK